LSAIVIDEPIFRNYIVEMEEGADHKATKNSLNFCQTLQLTLNLHPKNTNKPEVLPGLPIRSMQE